MVKLIASNCKQFYGSVCTRGLLEFFNELWQILISDFEHFLWRSKLLVKLPLREQADLTVFTGDQNLPKWAYKITYCVAGLMFFTNTVESLVSDHGHLTIFTVDWEIHSFLAIFRVTFLMLQVFFKWITWYAHMYNVVAYILLPDNFLEPQIGLETNGSQPVTG